jgi:hypothetical protein
MGKTTYLLMTLAGLFGFAAGVSPTARLVTAMRTAGDSPVPAKVAEAPVGRWVTLTDAKLRCETRAVYKDSMTFYLATDQGLANPFVAQFVGVVSCDTASPSVSGAFIPDPLTLADLAQYGVDARGATGLRLFTPLATPKYLRMALVPFVGFLLIGGGITAYGLRGLLRSRRAPGP